MISMLAFGGGNAVISLLERISVDRMQWVTPQDIAAAGTYVVTVKADGEPIPESHRAQLVVSFN